MRPNQNLYTLTADIVVELKPILEKFQPDFVYVHGDTTTTMAAAIASFYSGAKLCHIEAGLRTHNKRSPFPEEINRQITSRIADYHFAPTTTSENNLLKENKNPNDIIVTGNTVVDALFLALDKIEKNDELRNSLSEEQIRECFNFEYYTKNVDRIFDRVFGK